MTASGEKVTNAAFRKAVLDSERDGREAEGHENESGELIRNLQLRLRWGMKSRIMFTDFIKLISGLKTWNSQPNWTGPWVTTTHMKWLTPSSTGSMFPRTSSKVSAYRGSPTPRRSNATIPCVLTSPIKNISTLFYLASAKTSGITSV